MMQIEDGIAGRRDRIGHVGAYPAVPSPMGTRRRLDAVPEVEIRGLGQTAVHRGFGRARGRHHVADRAADAVVLQSVPRSDGVLVRGERARLDARLRAIAHAVPAETRRLGEEDGFGERPCVESLVPVSNRFDGV